MKILFSPAYYFYDGVVTGSEASWVFNICHRIATKHKDSVVITGFRKNKSKATYRVIESQPNKEKIDISFKNAFIFNLRYYLETKNIVRKDKFDLIHHVLPFGINSTYNLFFLLSKKRQPYIIGPVQSSLLFVDSGVNLKNLRDFSKSAKHVGFAGKLNKLIEKAIFYLFKPTLKILSKKTLEKADKIVVVNQLTKDVLSKLVSSKKIIVIPPGIDSTEFKNSNHKKTDTINLITVSYLTYRKGIDLLIKMMAKVTAENPNIHLSIVGDGYIKEDLEKDVKKLNLRKYIKFYGFVENKDVRKLYEKSDIFVNMSRSESWGQMYLEAMASGLPIIASKNPGSNEIIKNNEFGFLVDQEDYLSLAERVIYLSKNPKVIREFGYNARKEVERRYDWEKVIIPKYLKLYKDVKS